MTGGKMADGRRALGRKGEEAAAAYLEAEGYRILERNWRCPSGELDLIAETDGVIVFVEVRSRRDTGTFGTAEESVDARKRNKVRETANFYLYRNRAFDRKTRFDVIAVAFTTGGELLRINHIPYAF
ncbi:MAG: YraN family protein [Paenibacillus sp.]|jgi:putative endonuclease|nr:YraN family protein [Paenibacillus sp.]